MISINTGNEKKNNFINNIIPYVLLAKRQHSDNNILSSVVVAQAALESGWDLNAKTLFGIKGNGVSLVTTEYIDGLKQTVTDSFVVYEDVANAVEGYFSLIASDRYAPVRRCNDYKEQAEALYVCGYATDPQYPDKIVNIIEHNELYKIDEYFLGLIDTINYTELADRIEAGEFGNGRETRIKNFIAAGYSEDDYNIAQDIVNNRTENINYTELADRIEAGEFGNGRETRIKNFIAAGYSEDDYNIAQDIVNERC